MDSFHLNQLKMSNENLILFDDDYSMDEWVMRVEIFVLDVHYYLMLILDMSNLRPELKITTKKIYSQ